MNRRLLKEVEVLQRGDLSGMGIYIAFDESNIRYGHAMIIGPEGTPYEFCPLVFSFVTPADYPLSPPEFRILTSDGMTRFHPNLYVDGKVCLSILGTYSGPKWVSTMGIETVLKSIFSLLNDNPIVNEPGWERYTPADPVAKGYAEVVEYGLVRLTLAEARRLSSRQPSIWEPFRDVIEGPWRSSGAAARLREKVAARAAAGEKTYAGLPYGMRGTTGWAGLAAP